MRAIHGFINGNVGVVVGNILAHGYGNKVVKFDLMDEKIMGLLDPCSQVRERDKEIVAPTPTSEASKCRYRVCHIKLLI
jgi:hypothetical protein